MNRENILLDFEEQKSASEVAAFLRQIADSVEQGRLALSYADQRVELAIPASMELEVSVEQSGAGGDKYQLEVELEWVEGQPEGDLIVE